MFLFVIYSFVGVTLEAFSSCTTREFSSIKGDDIKRFSNFWSTNLDPYGTGFIPMRMVPPLIRSLGSPFDILSLSVSRMRYLCIREELLMLSKDYKTFEATRHDGPLLTLFHKFKEIEENLWRPILEEHSAHKIDKDRNAHHRNVNEEEEDSQTGSDGVANELSGPNYNNGIDPSSDDGPEYKIESDIPVESRHDPASKQQDFQVHPFQISGSEFGRRQSVVGKRRPSKARKAIKSSSSDKTRRKSFAAFPAAAKVNLMIDEDHSIPKSTVALRNPKTTWSIRLVQVPLWVLSKLIPTYEFMRRPPGHVRFDEVLNALIYWNPTFHVIPRNIVASRMELDQVIMRSVALQIILALFNGVVTRSRSSKTLLAVELSTGHNSSHDSEGEIAEESTPNDKSLQSLIESSQGFPNSWMEAARFWEREEEESTSRGALARILTQGQASLGELSEVASDLGLDIESKENIFEDEQIPDVLCSDPRLARACDHVRAKEIVHRLLKAGHGKLLKLYAEGFGFDVYSVPELSDLDGGQLLTLIQNKVIQAKVLEIDGPTGFDENEDLDEQLLEATNHLQNINAQVAKSRNERDQLVAVLAEARSRQMAAQAETDRVAAALRLQGIEVDFEDVADPLSPLSPRPSEEELGATFVKSVTNSQQDTAATNGSEGATAKTAAAAGSSELAKIRETIAIKRGQIQRLQEQLKISKAREANGASLNEVRTDEDEAAILACRQARLQRRIERRQQAPDPSNAASKSGLSAMGIEGPKKPKYGKGKIEQALLSSQRGKMPAWL